MSDPKAPKPYWGMTADELADATAEFDQEFVADTFGDPPPELKSVWQRIVREWQPPRSDEDLTVVRVGLETSLLAKLDRLAAARGLSRSALMAHSLRAVAGEGQT